MKRSTGKHQPPHKWQGFSDRLIDSCKDAWTNKGYGKEEFIKSAIDNQRVAMPRFLESLFVSVREKDGIFYLNTKPFDQYYGNGIVSKDQDCELSVDNGTISVEKISGGFRHGTLYNSGGSINQMCTAYLGVQSSEKKGDLIGLLAQYFEACTRTYYGKSYYYYLYDYKGNMVYSYIGAYGGGEKPPESFEMESLILKQGELEREKVG